MPYFRVGGLNEIALHEYLCLLCAVAYRMGGGGAMGLWPPGSHWKSTWSGYPKNISITMGGRQDVSYDST